MNYDNWKLSTDLDDQEPENECRFCGRECENDYCDSKCYNDDLND